MYLQNLEKKQIQRLQKMFESHFNKNVNFEHISVATARNMLKRVHNLMEQFHYTTESHYSEKNPAYLKLMLLSEGLSARIKDRQQINESEIQQAQVVLAAQDFVDRVQDMLEDVSEMQFKDLPALVNSIRAEIGTSEASQFNTDTSAALKNMIESLEQAKQQLESAISVVTGQEPIVLGVNNSMMQKPKDNISPDLDNDNVSPESNDDDNLPEPNDALAAKAAALGRNRR